MEACLLEALGEGLDLVLLALVVGLALAAGRQSSHVSLGCVNCGEGERGCQHSGGQGCSNLAEGALLLCLADYLPTACWSCWPEDCFLDLQIAQS